MGCQVTARGATEEEELVRVDLQRAGRGGWRAGRARLSFWQVRVKALGASQPQPSYCFFRSEEVHARYKAIPAALLPIACRAHARSRAAVLARPAYTPFHYPNKLPTTHHPPSPPPHLGPLLGCHPDELSKGHHRGVGRVVGAAASEEGCLALVHDHAGIGVVLQDAWQPAGMVKVGVGHCICNVWHQRAAGGWAGG